jgi:hypothetical protein
MIRRFWRGFAACLDLFGRTLLFDDSLLPPLFEVFTHVLRFRAVESRAGDYGELETSFLKQLQPVVVSHPFPDRCVQALEALFPRRVVAVGAAVYDKSPDAVALFFQLILDIVGLVDGSVAARDRFAVGLVQQGNQMCRCISGVLGCLCAGGC